MSAAAASTADAVVVAPKGKKKLLIIIIAALVVVLAGGGGAVFFLKKKAAAAAAAAEAEGDDAAEAPAHAAAKGKDGATALPTFLPLEPFVVNLADKDADRYAQVGITLEIDDPKVADQLKAYMPAIRNGILMVLAHKTSTELLERAGKVALAGEIMREAVRPLGIELEVPETEPVKAAKAGEDDEVAPKKKPKKKPAVHNPVRHVHFSNFIIQ
jgi:flagellar FliL protein